jgi:hypothetical protein
MSESVATVIVVAVFALLIVYNIRRRARMTPEERYRVDMLREQRKMRRELARRRYD